MLNEGGRSKFSTPAVSELLLHMRGSAMPLTYARSIPGADGHTYASAARTARAAFASKGGHRVDETAAASRLGSEARRAA